LTPNTKTRLAQIQGLMVHEILSKVIYADMLQDELEKIFNKNKLPMENQISISNTIKEIIEHPMLSRYFERDQRVFCEKDVLVPNGETLRPDRVNLLHDGSAVIIDYKTGKPKEADGRQIEKYAQIYRVLGYLPVEKLLVYINDEISVQKHN
jgi:ATP-dependent exoDNAse (exonuclease V) beta subunit